MNDLDFDLDLSGIAAGFDVPPGDVDSVVQRGRARAQRRQRVVATTAAVALVGTSVAGLRLLGGGEPTTTVATGGNTVRLGEDALAWDVVEPSSVLSFVQPSSTTVSPSGRLYALSTAPGEAGIDGQPLPRVVWQSDDGVDWAASPLSNDIFLSDLAVSDERIYAVGTGPATAGVAGDGAVPDLVVGWSDDRTDSWETATLPVDMAAIAEASRSVAINPEGLAVATTSEATVAVASINADIDVRRFLPDGVTAPNGWAVTPEGVDLLGPAPGNCPEGTSRPEGWSDSPPEGTEPPGRIWGEQCFGTTPGRQQVAPQEVRGVTGSFTWDELGVSGDVRRAALGQPVAFVAPAGSTDFEAVDLAIEGLGGFGISLHADGEGFLLVGPLAGSDAERAGSTVLASDDGRSWSVPSALPGDLGWINAAGRVGDTFVLLGQDQTGGGRLVADSGGGWSSVSLADLLGIEGSDVQVNLATAAIEAQGIVATVVIYEDGAGDIEHRVLTSPDATTWSAQSVSELIDEPVASVGQPVITGDQAVVPVAPMRPRDAGGHLQQVALVATFR